MNYFELYGGDYLRDTAELTLAEHGAYLKLLIRYYSTEKPLPADLAALHRICAAMDECERAAVDLVADRFFPVADNGLRHKNRCDEEIEKAQARIEAARDNGKKGGRPRKNPEGTQRKPSGIADRNPDGTQIKPSDKALHAPHASSITEPIGQTGGDAAADSVGQFEGHANPQQTPNPVAAFAVALNGKGFACTSLNPDLVAYVRAGGTVDHLLQVAAMPDCAGKKATYPIRVARRELAEGAKPVAASGNSSTRNVEGPSPRLSPEDEAARKEEALEAMRRQHRELGIATH